MRFCGRSGIGGRKRTENRGRLSNVQQVSKTEHVAVLANLWDHTEPFAELSVTSKYLTIHNETQDQTYLHPYLI